MHILFVVSSSSLIAFSGISGVAQAQNSQEYCPLTLETDIRLTEKSFDRAHFFGSPDGSFAIDFNSTAISKDTTLKNQIAKRQSGRIPAYNALQHGIFATFVRTKHGSASTILTHKWTQISSRTLAGLLHGFTPNIVTDHLRIYSFPVIS